jgi:hypothetical protein
LHGLLFDNLAICCYDSGLYLRSDINQGLNAIQTVVWQISVLVVLAFTLYITNKVGWLSALAWGGLCGITNVLLTGWYAHKKIKHVEAARQLRIMYRSVLERFFIVIGLIVFGLVKLHLAPIAIFLGFISCQLVYVVTSVLTKVTLHE